MVANSERIFRMRRAMDAAQKKKKKGKGDIHNSATILYERETSSGSAAADP